MGEGGFWRSTMWLRILEILAILAGLALVVVAFSWVAHQLGWDE